MASTYPTLWYDTQVEHASEGQQKRTDTAGKNTGGPWHRLPGHPGHHTSTATVCTTVRSRHTRQHQSRYDLAQHPAALQKLHGVYGMTFQNPGIQPNVSSRTPRNVFLAAPLAKQCIIGRNDLAVVLDRWCDRIAMLRPPEDSQGTAGLASQTQG